MERPTKCSDKNLLIVARHLIENLKQWGNQDIPESAEYDLTHVLDKRGYQDGYEIARCLDDLGWEINMQTVEELDYASNLIYDAIKQQIKHWVIENGIKPELSIGDRVIVKGRMGGEKTGVIKSIEESTAEYGVRLDEYTSDNHKAIVRYESTLKEPASV